jgi:hypothetical protein
MAELMAAITSKLANAPMKASTICRSINLVIGSVQAFAMRSSRTNYIAGFSSVYRSVMSDACCIAVNVLLSSTHLIYGGYWQLDWFLSLQFGPQPLAEVTSEVP